MPEGKSEFIDRVDDRYPRQTEFLQAVREVVDDIWETYQSNEEYQDAAILDRLVEPDRIVTFRIVWEGDDGRVHVNRGTRVQHNSAIGPYKGGLRFHPSVTPSVLKFLAFEQTLKNALTGLPMGGGKGGADFDPSGRSDREIMRFCTAFMSEFYRHIGPDTDIPAGDINVGQREIGYLFGAYRRIRNEFEGSLTGKGLTFGGTELRTEATGYGLIHFVSHMLAAEDGSMEGQRVTISGAGNVATYAADMAIDSGAKVLTLSDSSGVLIMKDGADRELIEDIRQEKASGGSLAAFQDRAGCDYREGAKPWSVETDIALPCATQNELDEDDAKTLSETGCRIIAEGANMPLTAAASRLVRRSGIRLAPAKAANAGGVAVSGLEISQNQTRQPRSRTEISEELAGIMKSIHDTCAEAGRSGKGGTIDYVKGANITGFCKVADAMLAQGLW